jgi:hypothetical protein
LHLLYFEFPVVKLLDYRQKWDELEPAPNPFAIATMTFLKTVETQSSDQERNGRNVFARALSPRPEP